MQTALRLTAQVLAGSRIEITAPQLREGDAVDVFVVLPDAPAGPPVPSVLELLDAMPPGPRSASTWPKLERALQDERDAWER